MPSEFQTYPTFMAQWHCVNHVYVNCHLYTHIPRFITTSQNANPRRSNAVPAARCRLRNDLYCVG